MDELTIKIAPDRMTSIRAIKEKNKVAIQFHVAFFNGWQTVRIVSIEKFTEDCVSDMDYSELRRYAFKMR